MLWKILPCLIAAPYRIKHVYQLQDINKIPLESKRFSLNSLASSDQRNTYTVSQLFEPVKQNDKNFNPNTIERSIIVMFGR